MKRTPFVAVVILTLFTSDVSQAVASTTLAGATAPLIATQPADLSVFTNQAATFTAAASGTPAPTVQWMVKAVGSTVFIKIGGANNPTLTLSAVTVLMSGNRYRANFTNSSGHAVTRAALLTVMPGTLDHLVVSPASSSVVPGASRGYRAEGFDPSGNDLGDVTAATTMTITPDGSCLGSVCTASIPGGHTVTGTDAPATGTAILDVTDAVVDHLTLYPGTAYLGPNVSQLYAVEAFDGAGNDLGDVTGLSTFVISASGSCTGPTCSASDAGTYTVSASYGAVTSTATLTVVTGKFVELIFSRTEVSAADGRPCKAADANVARLDTTIEPFLQSLGLSATGSIETGPTRQSTFWCSHFLETMATSWSLAQQLSTQGWTFVSHSLDYPSASKWSAMTPGQQWDETCGSAQTIDAAGLAGAADMFLWPDNVINQQAMVSFVEPCFGTNRLYQHSVTTPAGMNTAPHQQFVWTINGGHCNTPGAACSQVAGVNIAYSTPAMIISAINSLMPGQVLTLQTYLDVTGTNPAYSTNATRWDCTSTDPNLHWSNDPERYCWSDLQTILDYLASSGLGITQPGAVEAAFGRTGYTDHAVPRP